MSFAYWCVLAAAYLPIIWTAIAKSSRRFDNHAPRDYLSQTTGWRKRAHWTQLNGFEAFPPFAAAVIIASVAHAPQPQIDWLAAAFIAFRLIYGLFYLADKAVLRSLAWFAATGCVVALFVAAARAGG